MFYSVLRTADLQRPTENFVDKLTNSYIILVPLVGALCSNEVCECGEMHTH